MRSAERSATVVLCVALQMAAITLSVTSSRSHQISRDNNVLPERTCAEQLRQIYTDDVTAEVPPHVTGLWTSHACEIRPGPEYVLRQYRFHDAGLFDLRLFHYADAECRNATHGVVARGRYRFYQSSWIIPGSSETDYQLRHAGVVPYAEHAIEELRRKLSSGRNETRMVGARSPPENSCMGVIAEPWPLFERREVYSCLEFDEESAPMSTSENGDSSENSFDLDCLDLIETSFHELQLMRVEQRHRAAAKRNNASDDVIRTLLLGDIHTDRQQRLTYRPMGFQESLVQHESPGCNKICDIIARATERSPPQFPVSVPAARHQLPFGRQLMSTIGLRLVGSWASARCETRSYGVFLTRHLEFSLGTDDELDNNVDDDADDETTNRKRKRTWSGRQGYFGDVLCRHAVYAVETSGTYRIEDDVDERRAAGGKATTSTAERNAVDTFNVEFNVTRVLLTVFDKRITRQLNHLRTCGDSSLRSQWRVGEPVDVTSTSGCAPIGVHVAASELDIVRLVSSSPSIRGPQSAAGVATVASGHQHHHANAAWATRLTSPMQQLYLGQRPTDGGHVTDEARRPTSFQPALVRCGSGNDDDDSNRKSGGGKTRHGGTASQEGTGRGIDGVTSDGHSMTGAKVVRTSVSTCVLALMFFYADELFA